MGSILRMVLQSFCLVVTAVAAAAAPAPNVIWILADDAGYHDFGFQGNAEFREAGLTPHIDRIAAEGIVLERAYVTASVCSPSRAGLLTGRYQQRFGFENNLPGQWNRGEDPAWNAPEPEGKWSQWGLPLEETTLATRLKEHGYATALIGKWHQGLSDKFAPNARGFDYFYGLRSGSRKYFAYDEPYEGSTFKTLYAYGIENALFENGVRQPEPDYVTDAFGDKAAAWIERQAGGDKPFFLFLSFTAPHTPMHADDHRLAWARQHFPDLKPGSDRLKYVAMTKAMDDNVGKVLDLLEEHGLADNTLVVFFNDNGGAAKNAADNAPLRGHKWSPFEGGVRVPMAIRWPGVVEPGGRLDAVVSTLDLTPTHLAAAGVDPDETSLPLDGVDIRPWLEEPAAAPSSLRTLFWREHNSEGKVRVALHDPWKLILSDRHGPRLFNLEEDPEESTDIYSGQPTVAATLEGELHDWESQLVEPAWE